MTERIWTYSRGDWSEIESPFDHQGENEAWNDWLERNGYDSNPIVSYGSSDAQCVEVYENREQPSFLLVFNLSDAIEMVFIIDLPSLMQWLKDYALIFSLAQIEFAQNEHLKLLEKAFRAWHGHSSDNACLQCDPVKWQRLEQNRRERKSKGQLFGL